MALGGVPIGSILAQLAAKVIGNPSSKRQIAFPDVQIIYYWNTERRAAIIISSPFINIFAILFIDKCPGMFRLKLFWLHRHHFLLFR